MAEKIEKRDNSRQVLRDFLAGQDSFSKPFDINLARKIVRNDPLISASLETESNKMLEGGWGIKRKGEDNQILIKRFKKQYKFDNLLQTVGMNFRFMDALIEIGRKNEKVSDLNLLDTGEIKVETEPNGDPKLYYQEPGQENKDGEASPITWLPRNIVHIKFKDSILNFWGESDLRVLYDTVLIKDFIRQFMLWLFKTNQFRNHINFETVGEEQVKRFISFYKEGEKSYGKPIISDGKVTIEAMRVLTDLDVLKEILDWCDDQLRMALQQTPVSLGKGGQSRSEGDVLSDTQRTSIKAIQRKIADAINFDLFEKMGLVDTEFYWKPMDRMSEKSVFEIVEIMKRSMFSDDAVKEFMEKQGMSFKTKELFKEPEMGEVTPEQRSKKDASASRETKGQGEANTKIGTGEEGTTREDQLVKRDFDKYPYSYEVND